MQARLLSRSISRRARIPHITRTTPTIPRAHRTYSTMAETASLPPQEPVKQETKPLPKLSSSDFKIYNRMAEHMDYFHNHFRHTWNEMYSAASSGKRPANMSIRGFITMGEQFCRQLTMHHTIEEQHIFPVLAKKMDAFKEELELLTHHKLIHEGIEKMEKYFEDCRLGETELRMSEVKGIMDSFGSVLWEHLDAEVKQLGAENMRKYWSVKEMQRMPM